MSTPVRLVLFGVLLVVLGFAGAGLGAVVGPVGPAGSTSSTDGGDEHDGGTHEEGR